MAQDGSRPGKGDGNTNPLPRVAVRSNACRMWFFTWNNYDLPQFKTWHRSTRIGANRGKYQKVVAQQEVGAQGTPHIQGYIEFTDKVRPMEAKWLGLPEQVHWEPVRNRQAAMDYCHKTETQAGRPYTKNFKIPRELKILDEDELYEWQKDLIEELRKEPDSRKIFWYWSPDGGKGKTTFTRYLEAMHDACKVSGSRANVQRAIANWTEKQGDTPDLVILDLPKNIEDPVSYAGMEDIKNMSFVSTKFETISILGNHPNLVVFANHPPDEKRMTNNRFMIKEI